MRLVLEHQDEYESQWAAIVSVSPKIGCSAETLRKWVASRILTLAPQLLTVMVVAPTRST